MIGAAILAGGRATRYGGGHKGLLRLPDGRTIVERLNDEVAHAGIDAIAIMANEAEPYRDCGCPIVADLRPGMGPLCGIEAALDYFARGEREAVLFLPCDLPGIGATEISALKAAFEKACVESKTPIVAARTIEPAAEKSGGFLWEPLCSIVHNGWLDEIRRAIDAGERNVGRLWRRLGAIAVDFNDPRPFMNINTPEDWEHWLASSR